MALVRSAIAAAWLATAASAASSASSAASAGSWCVITDQVVLTDCGAACKTAQACAQYPSRATATCDAAARNTCSEHDASCQFQCLDLYNSASHKWTLFVKPPQADDSFGDLTKPFPAAPVESISNLQVPEDATAVQITGFGDLTVAKGTTKALKIADDFFANAARVTTLAITNINLEQLQTNFLPKKVGELVMDNCKLIDVPYDVRDMPNLKTLNLSLNAITELTSGDSKTASALQSLTQLGLRGNQITTFEWTLPSLEKLDLGDNKLTAFPMSVFNMTRLTSLSLDGNLIEPANFTAAQFSFFKRLDPTSTLGFSATPGSCASGSREDAILGSTVCIVDASSAAASTPAPKSASSSNLGLIIGIVAGAVVVVAVGGFIVYRRRSKSNEFYDVVMDNRSGPGNHSGPGTRSGAGNFSTNNSNTGGSAASESRSSIFGRKRAPSGQRPSLHGGGRPSRANSSDSRASNMDRKPSVSIGMYAEIGKYQEDCQSGVGGGTASLATGGARQRDRAQINQNIVRISSQDINYTRTIAKGAFGEVWLAHYGGDLVAVKKLLSSDPSSVGDFIAELNLLASLSHPRVLALIGACWDDKQSDLQIVTEYMDSGDLLTVLRGSSPTELSWEKHKASYCMQVCEAVFYLHSLQPALIHRDIKSRNILIDARKGAKLSDFGESRERTIQNTMTSGVGTARWVAPEIILGEDYSELADIYSLGVLLTELDTHQIPFEGLNLEEHMIVMQVSVGKLRPKVSATCPEVIRRLVHECLQFDPQLRPSAARVLQTLMASPLIRRLSTISDSE